MNFIARQVISRTFECHIAVDPALITLVRRQTDLSWRKITLQSENKEIVLTIAYESALQQNITPQRLTTMQLFV